MIITKLIGGLGNQMFQYAAGRRAAYANDTLLKLDITGYENQGGMTPREYVLNVFEIKEDFAEESEIIKLKDISIIKKLFNKIWPLFQNASYIREKFSYFDPKILKINDNSYLDGYWGSEKYFIDIEKIIRKEFTFKNRPDSVNQKMISRINDCNSVSIHIRRGDYVKDKKTNIFHGVCNLKYYLISVALITNRVNNPKFFIFSDDPLWARQNLHLEFPSVYIDHNVGRKDYEDMRLMSKCKHNIVANSSFSWWGAWLNQNPNKIVVAPKKWFRDKSIDTKDLIPESWIKI
jgi:hypothetical protein